jgi:peptidase M28-like protein
MQHVREISRRPHPIGGEDHSRVQTYLARALREIGLTPQLQEVTGVGTRYAVVGRVANVLVRVPGRTPGGPAVLLMAHYDGVPASPGAGDDGSGTAALLETLRAIRSSDTLAHDVIALFTDGEEPGLLGAAAFVREHPWAKDVAVTLNFEGRGTKGPSLMFETGPGNLDAVRVLRRVGGARATSLSTAVYRSLPNDTDLSELMLLQRPALNFAFIGGVQRYHSAEDDVGHLSPGTLQHHGNQALGLTRAFANGELPRPRTGDAVFFELPIIGLIVYAEPLALWLAIGALLLPIVALILVRKREQRLLPGTLLGFAFTLLAAVVAGIVGFTAAGGIQRLHMAMGSGAPEWSGIYALAIAFVAVAIASSGHAVARRWGSGFAVYMGVLLAWGALGLIVVLLLPGASFLVTWPSLLCGVAAIAIAARPESRAHPAVLWIAATIGLFILVPTLYLLVCVALGLNSVGGAILALFAALGAALLWIPIDSIAPRHRWRVPAVTAVVALVLFVAGTITVRSNRDHPAGASLVYAVDADSGSAWLSGFTYTPSAVPWLARSLEASGARRVDPVPPWLQRYADRRVVFSAPMSIPALAPSSASVLNDSSANGRRRVTLRIAPSRGTHSISMRAERGSILSAEVDGRPVETSRYRRQPRQWALSYAAPPDSGFVLALTFPDSESPVIGILSHRFGIPELSAIRIPQRPDGIIAIGDGDGSLVYNRLTIDRR